MGVGGGVLRLVIKVFKLIIKSWMYKQYLVNKVVYLVLLGCQEGCTLPCQQCSLSNNAVRVVLVNKEVYRYLTK